MEASFSENFERFTVGRLSITSGTVKLLGSTGKAAGVSFCSNLTFVAFEAFVEARAAFLKQKLGSLVGVCISAGG
jgi:hypothetical protein